MTDRDDMRVAKALQGADFPADRETLVSYVETRGGDNKTLQALRSVPAGRYANAHEVVAAVPQEPEGEDRPGGVAR